MRGMCLLKDDVKEENIIATAHNRIIRSLVGVAFSSLLIASEWRCTVDLCSMFYASCHHNKSQSNAVAEAGETCKSGNRE